MKEPKKPSAPQPGDGGLEEVERALSVLGGRHPDAVRAERQAAENAARRLRAHERAAAVEARRALWRRAVVALALGALAAAGLVVWHFHARRAAAEAEVAPLVARYASLGFDALPRATLAPERRAAATTVAGDCYAAVAARGARMHIARPVGAGDAAGAALFCTCASESVVVTSDAPVRLLHVSGAAFGGTRAVAYRFLSDAPRVLGGDDACSDDLLAAFVRGGKYPAQERSGVWLAAHPALAAAGFTTVATAPMRLPFVFVPPAGDTCFVAAGDGALTLVPLDGADPQPVHADAGVVAWCAVKPAPFEVARRGAGEASVVSAPSRRVGGLVGLRELTARAGLAKVTVWARADERGALAADTLRASLVPEPTPVGGQTLEAAQTKDARVLVFSSPGDSTFASNEADFRCAPSLAAGDALCVQARALTWHAPPPKADGAEVACGAAYGPLPFWMSVLASVPRADALGAELELVDFARRMTQRGFVPTVVEGVTERPASVEVLGRSGDDAVVAVGVWPAPPFVHPYGGDGPWTLDGGEPHVEPLTAGARVSFPAPARSDVPLERRRTVVFRHQANEFGRAEGHLGFTELARASYLHGLRGRPRASRSGRAAETSGVRPSMKKSARWFVVLGALGIASTALAGQVRGKIAGANKLLPAAYAGMGNPASHLYTWREPSPTVKPEFRALTANPSRDICIAATLVSGTAPAHDPIQITITGGHTIPTTIAVAPGTKLLFVNHDPFPHRLYEVSDPSFKESDMSGGGSRDWAAPGPGSYEFGDRLAPTLHFYVVVDPGVVEIVYPGHNGSFAFRDLAPGPYMLKAFFGGKQVGSQVQVTATHGNVELHDPLSLAEAK